MARFQGDLTESPALDTGAPVRSSKAWAKYIVGLGFMFTAMSLASNTVSPMINRLLNRATGNRVQAGGGGPWEGW